MKFSKGIRLALKIMAAIIAILALVTIIVANSSYVQNKLVGLATDALSKELNTEVKIDRVKLNLLGMSASIEGIKLKDQQQRDMLKVKRIWGHLRAMALLKGEILLRNAPDHRSYDPGRVLLAPLRRHRLHRGRCPLRHRQQAPLVPFRLPPVRDPGERSAGDSDIVVCAEISSPGRFEHAPPGLLGARLFPRTR